MNEEAEHRITDSFYIYALKKTTDNILIFIAILFNLVFLQWPW